MSKQTTDNVDPAEIKKFEDLAERWWDPSSEFKPLHAINPLRTNFINQRSPVSGLKVLDIGCGGGILAEALATLGADVTAIDMGEAPLNIARLHQQKSGLNIDYRQILAEQLATQEAGRYDIVTCLEMLEHVPKPASTIAACAELVKPEGHVYFATINRNPKSWLMAIVGAEYVLNLLPRGTHEYKKLIKPSELEGWARQANLKTMEMTGMHYNPFSQHYTLGAGVDVNYLMHTIKQN